MSGLLHITPFFFNTYSQGAPQIVKTQVVIKLRHTLRHSTCVSMSFGIIEPHKVLGEGKVQYLALVLEASVSASLSNLPRLFWDK